MGKTFGEAGPAYIPVRVTFDTIADAPRDSLCTHEAKSEPTDKPTHRRTQPTSGPTSVLTPPSGTHSDPWDNSRRAHPPVAMSRGRGCVLEQPLSFRGLVADPPFSGARGHGFVDPSPHRKFPATRGGPPGPV